MLDQPDQNMCSICFDQLVFRHVINQSVFMTDCGHYFHEHCLLKLTEYKCPNCRCNFETKEYQFLAEFTGIKKMYVINIWKLQTKVWFTKNIINDIGKSFLKKSFRGISPDNIYDVG